MHVRDLCRFLHELEQNNNRAWFVMNRPRYDILRDEFLTTITELIAEVARFDPAVRLCNPKKAIFRINRDVRFSHDKSPYKTIFSAAILPNDLKRPSEGGGPCYYMQIDGNGVAHYGGGEYMPPAWRLRAIREQIANPDSGFASMLKNKALKKRYGDIQQEGKMARVPKGYPADHVHAEYLKLKSFFVWTETPLALDQPERLVPDLAAAFADAQALVGWLRQVQAQPPEAP